MGAHTGYSVLSTQERKLGGFLQKKPHPALCGDPEPRDLLGGVTDLKKHLKND